ncbi:M23 family metallopeptidase [Verticiella sediminum]|nr:M23 family metallopeptidase [Verticiella sediminum]
MVSQNADATVVPDIRHIVQTLQLPEPVAVPSVQAGPDDGLYVREERVQRGDSVASMLNRLEVSDPALQRFLVQEPAARSIYQLYPGRAIQVATDAEGELRWLRYVHTPGAQSDGEVVQQLLEVLRTPEGGFEAAEHEFPAERRINVGMGTIRSSLFGATDAAGVPYNVTQQMIDILASDVDFFRDLRPGDQFRVVYETFTTNGENARSGRVLALEFVNNGKSYEAVWYDPDEAGKSGGYFALDGTSRRRAFLRVPLEFTRISSGFGLRRHPVLNTMRGHKGVDYAAPPGTPIRSTADGTVEFIGSQRGYGNTVIVKHHGEYTTLYAHMRGFASNLRKGSRVAQGDVIGYVGSTGMATGPHLHYEFRIAGRQIDPQSSDIPIAQSLDGKELDRFKQHVASYRGQLDMLANLQKAQDGTLDTDGAVALADTGAAR